MKYFIYSRRYSQKNECYGQIKNIIKNYKDNNSKNIRYEGCFNCNFEKINTLSNLKMIKFLIEWAGYPDILVEFKYDRPKIKIYE